ncbi:hypothetical protein B0H15DRAFT_866739 [Mycena belliarum]|uniref:Uncharacterized protein n=1 Tax=Mycena belliarum TaxID=1033014 RepID=A0AAD6TRD5_9AGAR|nr:hypothetical protein B0H15DRAFT_866739 [Mycena belliae]
MVVSSALTAEQVQVHAEHLASTVNFRVFPILAETVLYGIFIVLIFFSSYILVTSGLRSPSSKLMLAATLIMFGLSTLDWAIDVHLLRDELNILVPADLIKPPPDHSRRLRVNTALQISQAIMNNICVLLSDTVVCWRVYMVYGRSRRVLWTAAALLSALFSALFICNLTQIGIGFPSVRALHRLKPGELYIDIIALALCALINMWATSMIAVKAWQMRRDIRRYLKGTSRRTFAESVLALFVESGALYTALWILKNVIIIPSVEGSAYTYYATVFMYQITGMYPTLIIILVALNQSHLEHQFTGYRGGQGNTVTSSAARDIVFASAPKSSALSVKVAKKVLVASDSRTDLGSKDAERPLI